MSSELERPKLVHQVKKLRNDGEVEEGLDGGSGSIGVGGRSGIGEGAELTRRPRPNPARVIEHT